MVLRISISIRSLLCSFCIIIFYYNLSYFNDILHYDAILMFPALKMQGKHREGNCGTTGILDQNVIEENVISGAPNAMEILLNYF